MCIAVDSYFVAFSKKKIPTAEVFLANELINKTNTKFYYVSIII